MKETHLDPPTLTSRVTETALLPEVLGMMLSLDPSQEVSHIPHEAFEAHALNETRESTSEPPCIH